MLIAAAAAVVAAAVVTNAGAREATREIHLVARGMSFYLASDPMSANPTIAVRRGERVRFVLRNETPGFTHDLAIAALGVAMTPVSAGESGTVDVEIPEVAGRHEYLCRPHSVMMKGTVEIQ